METNNAINTDERLPEVESMDFVIGYWQLLINNAMQVKAMIEEAQEKWIDYNIDQDIKTFQLNGEVEKQLISMVSKINWVKSNLYMNWIKMTKDDLEKRLTKMWVSDRINDIMKPLR